MTKFSIQNESEMFQTLKQRTRTMPTSKPQKSFPFRKLQVCISCLAISYLLCGCSLNMDHFSLALEEAPSGEDRLAGIFVTDRYIDTSMPELTVDIWGEISLKEQDSTKIYGSVNESSSQSLVSFPGLEGFGLYNLLLPNSESSEASTMVCNDGVFTDLHFTVTDEESTAEGSLYVSTERPCSYYFNPVYQQDDGQLYLLPGSGVSTDSFTEGASFSHSVSSSMTQSAQTGTSFNEATESYRFTVNIVAAETLEQECLIVMDSQNQIIETLSEQQLEMLFQQDVPQLELPSNAAYLILEQSKNGQSKKHRSLFDYGAEYLEYMKPIEKGYFSPVQLPLLWPETTP